MPPGTSLSVFLLTETIFHAWLPKQVPLSPQHSSSSVSLSIQPLPIHSTYIQAVLLPGKEEFKLLVFYVLQKWDSKNTRCIMAPDCFMLECHCNSSSSPISATHNKILNYISLTEQLKKKDLYQLISINTKQVIKTEKSWGNALIEWDRESCRLYGSVFSSIREFYKEKQRGGPWQS